MFFSTGKEYHQICQTKDVPYMNSMLFQGGNRDSCYHCPFATIPRQGDFTLADLWGWREIVPEWNDNKGISLILCNTAKAITYSHLFLEYADVKEITLDQAKKQNPNLCQPTRMPFNRLEYMEDIKNLTFDELEKKWLKPRSVIRKILSNLLFKLK